MSVLDEAYRKAGRELNAALARAQADFPPITQDRTVEVQTKAGGTYTYTYAPLESILAAVRPVLAANGLALIQLLEDDGRGPALRTELRHAGGGVISGTFPLPSVPPDPQALGSLLTYLRRYAITAILGIATERDDDGQAAKPQRGGRAKERASKPRPRATPSGQFTPPGPRGDDPELAGLVTEVQERFTRLRDLEGQLEVPGRDWSAWARHKAGLAADEVGTADHYRKAIEALDVEESRLVGELAARTKRDA